MRRFGGKDKLDEAHEAKALASLGKGEEGNRRTKRDYLKRRLKKKIDIIDKKTEKAQSWLKFVLIAGGLGIFTTLAVGAVFLEQAESCRYPRHKLDEEYRYKIDVARDTIGVRRRGGKVFWATGPKVENFYLNMDYGSYTLLADPNPEVDEIVFRVANRARDKFWLTRMTSFDAILVNKTNEASNITEIKAEVSLNHVTSNTMSGDITCQRSDVTIIVPSACLLDETKMTVVCNTGNIATRGLELATFEELTLQNDMGDIVARDINSYKLNVNTSQGTITAQRVTAHIMFLLVQNDGGVIMADDITLYAGDDKTSCRQVVTVVDGFDQYPQVEVVCDQEDGELTIDSRGAENGGFPAIEVNRISGGNVVHKVKVGHTKLQMMACYDFAGNFTMDAQFGSKIVKMAPLPPSDPRALSAQDILLGLDNSANNYFQLTAVANSTLYGQICCTPGCLGEQAFFNSGANSSAVGARAPGTQTLNMESITTGNLEIELLPPEWRPPTEVV